MFDLMTIKDFAKEINKSESTIRTWKRRGEIPSSCFHTIGDSVFIKTKVFQKWVDGS